MFLNTSLLGVGLCQRPLFFFRLSPVPFEHPDVLAVKLHRPVGAEQAGEDAVAVPFAEHLFVEVGADHGRAAPDDAGIDEVVERGDRKARGELRAEVVDCLLYTSPSPRDRG